MDDDLKTGIHMARKAILRERVVVTSLLGKKLYGSLDAATMAFRRGDREAVRRELDSITKILMQS